MPRFHEDDDDVEFPAGVKVAGIMWIGFGILGLTGVLISFLVNVGVAGAQEQAIKVGGLVCGSVFAVAFLAVGIMTVTGKAQGTIGNGLGSLVFSLLYLFQAIALGVAAAKREVQAGTEGTVFAMAGLFGLLAAALLTAGVLALVGHQAYQDWYAGQDEPRRRRRRGRGDDDEDRPRRRRHREPDDEDRPRRRRQREDDD